MHFTLLNTKKKQRIIIKSVCFFSIDERLKKSSYEFRHSLSSIWLILQNWQLLFLTWVNLLWIFGTVQKKRDAHLHFWKSQRNKYIISTDVIWSFIKMNEGIIIFLWGWSHVAMKHLFDEEYLPFIIYASIIIMIILDDNYSRNSNKL